MFDKRPKALSIVVAVYILAAFVWWAILLHREIDEKYAIQINSNLSEKEQTDAYHQYRRDKSMIWGETIVVVMALGIGFWIVQRSHKKELSVAKQQRNFLLSITHELKTPISAIRLALQTLTKRNLNINQEQKLIHNSIQESNRLEKLIENILLAAKLDSPYHVQSKQFDKRQFFADLVAEARSSFPDAQIKLKFDKIENSGVYDPFSIRIVTQNLIENAVKYNDEMVARIDICISETAEALDLTIKDNGKGIDDAHKDKIFEQFFRVGSEEVRSTKGTGLGLYISKKILDNMNAKIKVENNTPKGTIFNVSIPSTNG